MADKPKLHMKVQADQSALFRANDGITIRVAFDSPTQVRVEMWRDSDKALVAPDVGNIGTKSFRERLLKQARETFNPPPGKGEDKAKNTVPHLEDDLDNVATALGVPAVADLLKPESARTLVDQLVEIVEEAGELFTTPEGEPHAALNIDGHVETHEIRGTRFRRWLRGHFYAVEKARLEAVAEASYESMLQQFGGMIPGIEIPVRKPPVVRDQVLGDAIAQLEAKADYEKVVQEVYVRCGHHAEKLYVDLGGESWESVEIDAEGWRIVDTAPVRFVRPKGLGELPLPEAGGSLDDLREILTLGDDEDDRRSWALMAAFLANSLRSNAPEYPILVLLGAQGSAKSTTSRMLRALLDPNVVEDTGEPRSKEELHIDAECSWVTAYDNLSGLSPWLSDAMCRISTGSAFTKRTQYTNRDREIFKSSQPQILNGIADVVQRGDIIDRGLLVTLPVITEYKDKGGVWRGFYDARPKIMGALYTAVAAGIRSATKGEEITEKLPRMADFAKWSIGCEKALGLKPGEFLEAFSGSGQEGANTVLEAEPISYRIYTFAKSFTAERPWEGTSGQLLEILNEREDDIAVRRDRSWPKAPNKLSGLLGRIAPALAKHGVIWAKASGSNKKGKIYHLYHATPPMGDDTSSAGDDTEESTVPQKNAIDPPNMGGGTIGDDGDDRNSPSTGGGDVGGEIIL